MSSYKKVNIADASSVIIDELNTWSSDIQRGVRELTDKKADELQNILKQTSPKNTGKYSKAWKIKKTEDTFSRYEKTVYNQHYQRTHLLENGHALRNGGRTIAKIHIAPAQSKIEADFVQELKRIISKS